MNAKFWPFWSRPMLTNPKPREGTAPKNLLPPQPPRIRRRPPVPRRHQRRPIRHWARPHKRSRRLLGCRHLLPHHPGILGHRAGPLRHHQRPVSDGLPGRKRQFHHHNRQRRGCWPFHVLSRSRGRPTPRRTAGAASVGARPTAPPASISPTSASATATSVIGGAATTNPSAFVARAS